MTASQFVRPITILVLLSLLLFTTNGLAKEKPKSDKTACAMRLETAPAIDGQLNDPEWEKLPGNNSPDEHFYQMRPYNGTSSTEQTLVKMGYTNEAIYIAAQLLVENPETITQRLTTRDSEHLTDYFFVLLDPFNDGLNGFGFKVTSSGVQVDEKHAGNRTDKNWDAVWNSAVSVDENGWYVEMKIPFSELRFPSKDIQTWGINFFRNIEKKREYTSWNFVDRNLNGLLNQSGELHGIKHVDPPLRLSFIPYISSYVTQTGDESPGFSIKGGMDVKYGINQSYTLDMMLIPDFGQVAEDDQVLNLGPFETYYGEKRQFFIEGKELFDRAGIFYSRRIGSTPVKYYEVADQLQTNEKIVRNPSETQLINATKLSGRSGSGLGVGVLNAMTSAAHATIKDTLSGDTRKMETQGFTNYNVSVIDQSLKNNSYISLINTNLTRADGFVANTSGTEMEFRSSNNMWGLEASGAVSQQYSQTADNDLGYYYALEAGKISGNFQVEMTHRIESDTYDPNYMGFLRANNEIANSLRFRYNRNEPFSVFLDMYNSLRFSYNTLYKPAKYNQFSVNWSTWTTLQNYLTLSLWVSYQPFENHDYYEARVENQVFKRARSISSEFRISSDYRKTIALDAYAGYYEANYYDQHNYWFGVSPRFQPNNQLTIVYNFRNSYKINNIGFVDVSAKEDTIFFGKRDMPTVINSLNASYIFNNRASMNLRFRHYWSQVGYRNFYELQSDGYLNASDAYSQNADLSYNALNMQLAYNWNFAPGSQLSLVWKNAIYDQDDRTYNGYFDNIDGMFQQVADNSLSVKLLYYIHYDTVEKFMQII